MPGHPNLQLYSHCTDEVAFSSKKGKCDARISTIHAYLPKICRNSLLNMWNDPGGDQLRPSCNDLATMTTFNRLTLHDGGGGFGIWVFPKIVGKPPKWMVKIMEIPIKSDDLGGYPTIFGNLLGVLFEMMFEFVDDAWCCEKFLPTICKGFYVLTSQMVIAGLS